MTRTGWVRVGTDTTCRMLVTALGLAALAAVLIAAPVAQLVHLTSGATTGWWVAALWCFLVLAVALGVPLVILSNRPVEVNLDEGLVRVAWRTVPIAELRHAYRMPGGTSSDQFVLQLELERGLDARLPVRSAALPNLTAPELEVILELMRRAPIEPKPGFPVRSPLAGELGARSESEQIADEVSDALQPFGRVAYRKATLELELEDSLERAHRASIPVANHEPLPSERARSGLGAPPPSAAGGETVEVEGEAAEPQAPGAPRRGLGRRRRAVESWIAENGGAVRTHTPTRVIGWVIIVSSLVIPWVLSFAVLHGTWRFGTGPITPLLATWGAAILSWPFFVWLGVVLLKRARALRNASARREALALRVRGIHVPDSVREHFASDRLERSYGVHVYLLLIVLSLAFLVSGLLFLALSADMVGGPYSPLPWHAPLGWLLMIPAIPVFVGVLRWQRYMQGQLARAQVEWRLLGNSSVQRFV